jgi:periplasmic protein TonB
MKTCAALLALYLLCDLPALAQSKEDVIYLYDANWQPIEAKKASYFLRVKKVNDTTWQWDTYNYAGPLLKSEITRDEQGEIQDGQSYFYKPGKGTVDSIHDYRNNLAHGSWYYYNDTGAVYLEKRFFNGRLIHTVSRLHPDSVARREKMVDTADDDEIESEFRGGARGWLNHINKNIRYPERALNWMIQGRVVVQFIVDTVGRVSEPRIFKSLEFSVDEEALRIIQKSPLWTPAFQRGRKVKSYKRQPIDFRLQ